MANHINKRVSFGPRFNVALFLLPVVFFVGLGLAQENNPVVDTTPVENLSEENAPVEATPATTAQAESVQPTIPEPQSQPQAMPTKPLEKPVILASAKQEVAQSMTDLWSAMGISESQWGQFIDGVAWDANQNTFAVELISGLNKFPLDLILPWTQSEEETSKMLNGKNVEAEQADIAFELRAFNRNSIRGTRYHLTGTAEVVEEIPLIPELWERFDLKTLYFVAVKLSTGQKAVIVTSTVPDAWEVGKPVSYPISADACFLKYGQLDKQKDMPVHSYFIASRIAWHPNTTLGNLGMDYGLFDDLDSRTLPPGRKIPFPADCTLNERNRECFFQELATVKKTLDSKEFSKITKLAIEERDDVWKMRDPRGTMISERQSYPVEVLFNNPIAQRGKLFWLSGRAKRIVAIPVESEDVKTRFGIDKYYNIYLFTHDSDDNPLVIIALQLPDGVETGDGANFSVDLSMPCFMFNTWMYKRAPDAQGKTYQLAPLLMASKVLKMDATKVQTNYFISNSILAMTALIILYFFLKTLFSKPTSRVPKQENFEFKPYEPNAVEPEFNYEFPEKKRK